MNKISNQNKIDKCKILKHITVSFVSLLLAITTCACTGVTEGGNDISGPDNIIDTASPNPYTDILEHMGDPIISEDEDITPEWDTNPYKLYVSKSGSDDNNGTKENPFATIEAATIAIRGIDKSKYTSITVYVAPGDYRVSQLGFLAEDSGTENCIITYRAEKRGAIVRGGWFKAANKDGTLWKGLDIVPWWDTAWQLSFSAMRNWTFDFESKDDPGFLPNPANSTVKDNLIVAGNNSEGYVNSISSTVKEYSEISNNVIIKLSKEILEQLFKSSKTGDFTLNPNTEATSKLPDFSNIPCEKIGIQN